MAHRIATAIASVRELYRDGFRNMTWGRELCWIVLLKLVILFGVLRVFFFKPAMAGRTDEQKSEIVGRNLTETGSSPGDIGRNPAKALDLSNEETISR